MLLYVTVKFLWTNEISHFETGMGWQENFQSSSVVFKKHIVCVT